MTVLAGVFLVPMLAVGACHLGEPGVILDQFQNIRRGEKLNAVGRRVAQRLEQPGRDEDRRLNYWPYSNAFLPAMTG